MFLKGGQLVVTCQSPFIYSVYTNITLQSAMQALHCVRQKKIGRHRATMSGGWHGTTPAIACQEGLLGHNIITKEELHAHNTFSNGNQVISNVSNGHENSLVCMVTLLWSDTCMCEKYRNQSQYRKK